MEEAVNIVGYGFQVCVLLQGNKVSDESYTLEKLGIEHGGKLDYVGLNQIQFQLLRHVSRIQFVCSLM